MSNSKVSAREKRNPTRHTAPRPRTGAPARTPRDIGELEWHLESVIQYATD